jgi:hypothetical protein
LIDWNARRWYFLLISSSSRTLREKASMPGPFWRFREKQIEEQHQEAANTEFFAQQDVAERLVREAGQNTIDAAEEGAPPRLVFSLTTLPSEFWKEYFASLWPHLEAHEELRPSLPSRDQAVPCLLVEDFGTTGLTGPLVPHYARLIGQDEKYFRLFWFFKNVGRTSKTGSQLGSFGIGKTVFPYSSRINSFFGLTVRNAEETEPPVILLGQSQLREHCIENSGDLDPFGFFARHEGEGADYRKHAISDLPMLTRFRSAFGLHRNFDEPGLSVVIPYPSEELTGPELAKAAISQFFLPILSGQLEVEIHDAKGAAVFSSKSLLESINQIPWGKIDPEPLRRHVRLATWALIEGKEQIYELARPTSPTQPKFSENMIEASRRIVLSQKFISGQRLAFRIPVPVEPIGSSEVVWSHVEVFMEYDRNSSTKEDLYVRKGLTLVEHRGKQANQPGLRSILIAQDPPIYEMLRASENVAHTKWRQKGADKLTQQYIRGPSKIGFVLGTVPSLVQALLSPEEEADWWTLADLFPQSEPSPLLEGITTPSEQGETKGSPVKRPPTQEEEIVIDVPPGKVRQWRVKPTQQGLRIEPNPKYEGDFRPMRFVAAYGLLNRHAYGSHNPADFSFEDDKAMINATDASVRVVDHNRLEITPLSRHFAIELTGFDQRRSLDYQLVVDETADNGEEDE